MDKFDHIILCTEQATGTLLGKLIPTNKKITVVEGGKIGGSCINYGFTPTKTLVASACAIHVARRGSEFGFKTGPVEIDYSSVRERMKKIRNSSSDGSTKLIESNLNVWKVK